MARITYPIDKEQCEYRGWHWIDGACYTTPAGPADPREIGMYDLPVWLELQDIQRKQQDAIIDHGAGMLETWRTLALEKPPDDIIGKAIWFFGVIGQMILSIATFPATLSCFLMEEMVQTAGMGAYILSSSRYYDLLDTYLPLYLDVIESARVTTTDLSIFSPIVGGTVLKYIDASTLSYNAFRSMADRKVVEQLEKESDVARKVAEEQKYGTLRLYSVPSQAEIWIDGINTELITPQTFKNMEAGEYTIEVRRMNPKTDGWDIYVFSLVIEAGRTKEVRVRIPVGVTDEIDEEGKADEIETPKLPEWIKAEVEGDYAVDGDTFRTSTGERIRILGIDAPETGRPWADVAGAYLDDLVHGKNISLRIQSHKPLDEYGRTLARCKMYKGDIAELMLSAGYARLMVFDDDIYDPTSYQLAEDMAKERRIGIWGEMP